MSANMTMPRAPERPVLVAPFDGRVPAHQKTRSQFTPLAIVALSVAVVLLAATVFLFISKNSVSADLDTARATVAAQQERIDTMKGTIAGLEEENATLTSENADLSALVSIARNSWETYSEWMSLSHLSNWDTLARDLNEALRQLFPGRPPVRFTPYRAFQNF